MVEIIHSRPAERAIADGKPGGFDDVGRNPEASAQPQDGARVLRNVRFIERKMHCRSLLSDGANWASRRPRDLSLGRVGGDQEYRDYDTIRTQRFDTNPSHARRRN